MSNRLSTKGKTAIVLPDLTSSSLASLGQLCDDGCKVNLDKHKLSVHEDEDLIIEGARNKTDGLWDIPITSLQNNYSILTTKGLYHKLNISASSKVLIPQFMKDVALLVNQNIK